MKRVGAALGVVLWLASAWIGLGAGPAAAQVALDADIGGIDAFWTDTFAEAAVPYWSAGVVAIETNTETECGTFSPWIVAGYCPLEGTIYYSAPIAREITATGDDFALTTIIAHEWGHHVQFLRGQFDGSSFALEQQADCLAGAYTQRAAALGQIDTSEVMEAVRIAAISGDASWLPQDAHGAHGSGPQRANAFMDGYLGGVAGCGLGL